MSKTYFKLDVISPSAEIEERELHKEISITTNSEIILWNQFRSGSKQAFNAIYYKYVKILFNYGRKITSNTSLIEDCIQDLFVELWQKKELLSETTSIKFYLFRAVNRKIVRVLKSESKIFFKDLSEDYDFEVVFSHEVQLISEQISKEDRDKLAKALNGLTSRQKEAIYLKYYEKLSFEEVSSILEISVKGTYKIISRALEALKNAMNGNFSVIVTLAACFSF